MLDSIYYFKNPKEFNAFIHSIANKSITVFEALGTYREISWLPSKFRQMTVQELSSDDKLIGEIDTALRHATKNKCAQFESSWTVGERQRGNYRKYCLGISYRQRSSQG